MIAAINFPTWCILKFAFQASGGVDITLSVIPGSQSGIFISEMQDSGEKWFTTSNLS